MANLLQNFGAACTFYDLFAPQVFSATANGTGVSVATTGADWMSARLVVGAVSALTTLDVKLQASDTVGGTYVDIAGAVFTTVTAATKNQTIDFQLPTVTTAAANPYIFVRAVGTLVGTNVNFSVVLIGSTDNSGVASYVNEPLTIN